MKPISIIICTRNRPFELTKLLESLTCATAPIDGHFSILVIDSSLSTETKSVSAKFANVLPIMLHTVHSDFSLTKKRNIAIQQLSSQSEFVFFLDDDIEVRDDFFLNTLAVFEDAGVVGVGGRDLNLPPLNIKKWQEMVGLSSFRQGAVLMNGQNTPYSFSQGNLEVEWFSGCAMSFRTSALEGLLFDERRAFVGEDVDFCMRMNLKGKLISNPDIVYKHKSSLESVPSSNHKIRDFAFHRSLLAFESDRRVRFLPTLFTVFILGLLIMIKGAIKLKWDLFCLGIRHIGGAFLLIHFGALVLLARMKSFLGKTLKIGSSKDGISERED